MFFLRVKKFASCIFIIAFVGLGTVTNGAAFAQPSEILVNFRGSASNFDVDLTIREGESAQQEFQLCMPSCPSWATGLVDGDLEFTLYRMETNVPGAQGHLAIGETGLTIELSGAATDDNLFGGMILFVDEPVIDLLMPVTVELLFSEEDSMFDSLETAVDLVNLTDGGADGESFFASGTPPSSISFHLFLPEDDPPLDPFAIHTTFALSGNSHARVAIERIRVGFFIPEPSAIKLYLFGALGLLCAIRQPSALL